MRVTLVNLSKVRKYKRDPETEAICQDLSLPEDRGVMAPSNSRLKRALSSG